MTYGRIMAIMAASLIASGVYADPPAHSTSAPLASDSDIKAILQRLDDDGIQLRDFRANVVLSHVDLVSGDSNSESGAVLFKNADPAASGDAANPKILVDFTKETNNDRSSPIDHKFSLADGWLTDRDQKTRKEVKRQVLKPGEKIDLFKLGEGPFPLPIGQSPDDVLTHFDVTRQPAAGDDPPGTVHLQLTPKAGTAFARKFSQLDVFIDLKSGWPARIEAEDANKTHTDVTDLSDLKTNTGLKDSQLALPPVTGDWSVTEEPFE